MSWVNNDGLERKFGVEQAKRARIGEYRNDGPSHLVEIHFDFTDLPAVASNSVIISDDYTLPSGAFIESVEIWCPVDVTSGGTLNVGMIDTDRTSNADVDAFVVAATAAELTTGGENIAGWVGALVNDVLPRDVLLTWEQDTAAATTGEGVIRIKYYMPVT